jgi:putative oxidoreductase
MKILTLIARILLGLVFLVFGLNIFLNFIHQPPPTGTAGQFAGILFTTHYLSIVGAIEVICGLLFIANRYVPLALTLIGPVIVNILIFHSLMQLATIPPALLVTILWFVLFYYHRAAFAGIFTQNA